VNSPLKKFRTQPSAGEVMCAAFWDREGLILLALLGPGQTASSDRVVALTELKAPTSRSAQRRAFLLQCSNARPQSSLKSTPPALAGLSYHTWVGKEEMQLLLFFRIILSSFKNPTELLE